MRGGGGNFGIVTSFEFRLHPMRRQILGGDIFFPMSRARDVLTLFAGYGPVAPDHLQLDPVMVQPPGGAPGMVGFGVCYCGPASRADRAMALIWRLGTPMVDGVTGMDYVALQRLHDTDDPRAVAAYLKSGFVSEITADLVTAIVDGFDGHPERATQILFQQSGGAIGRVAPGATAFSQRDARANMLASVVWPYGSDLSAHIAWCRQYWAGLEPFTYGFYTNDDSIELTAQQVASNYRQNLERLVAVKNRYDPSNLFRLNANVVPPV